LVTLVAQGLTLPALIRRLGLAGASDARTEMQKARGLVLRAAVDRLEDMRRNDSSDQDELYGHVAQHYEQRLASVGAGRQDDDKIQAEHHLRYLDLSRTLLDVERQAALRLRDNGTITDEVLREVEHELDLSESRLLAMRGLDS